jgi:hypothetical protein
VTLASGAATYPIVVVTLDEARRFAMTLPRTTEGLVGGRVKFYLGRIVYLSSSRDETVMGFAFPKEERRWWAGRRRSSCSRRRPVCGAAIDEAEVRELVLDAWRMVVPKRVAAAHDAVTSRRT